MRWSGASILSEDPNAGRHSCLETCSAHLFGLKFELLRTESCGFLRPVRYIPQVLRGLAITPPLVMPCPDQKQGYDLLDC